MKRRMKMFHGKGSTLGKMQRRDFRREVHLLLELLMEWSSLLSGGGVDVVIASLLLFLEVVTTSLTLCLLLSNER